MVEVRCSSAESVTAQSTDRSRGCSEASAQASTTLTATRKVGSGLQCAILNSSLAVFTSTIYPPKLPLTREQNANPIKPLLRGCSKSALGYTCYPGHLVVHDLLLDDALVVGQRRVEHLSARLSTRRRDLAVAKR